MREEEIDKIREESYKVFGRTITFYNPGLVFLNSETGDFPAISITGNKCELKCDHCFGKILNSMIKADTPHALLEKCISLKEKGITGCLMSGGSRKNGSLAWNEFIPVIKKIKEMGLFVSVHSGIIDRENAKKLKGAGVDQALIDIIGDDETFKKIYHVKFGIEKIEESVYNLKVAGIPFIPHIVSGIDYGKIKGEFKAVEMVKKYSPESVVFVVFMPLEGTPMENIKPQGAEDLKNLFIFGRKTFDKTPLALGCARPRRNLDIEILALNVGFNRIAIPSQRVIKLAKAYDLKINYLNKCCSVF